MAHIVGGQMIKDNVLSIVKKMFKDHKKLRVMFFSTNELGIQHIVDISEISRPTNKRGTLSTYVKILIMGMCTRTDVDSYSIEAVEEQD